jgi:RimJ/RimL family protein N-acetyltransferase
MDKNPKNEQCASIVGMLHARQIGAIAPDGAAVSAVGVVVFSRAANAFCRFVCGNRMIDARHFSARETLRSGREVQVRSLRPDDGERMAEAFAKLEQESIQTRFFGAKSGLTESDHQVIRELDFGTRVILVVTLIENGREIIIGSGGYSRIGKDAAEVALLVEEDYQSQGLARRLLFHLGQIAQDQGIVRFEAYVLPHNTAMLRVFAVSGWAMIQSRRDGILHVKLRLI